MCREIAGAEYSTNFDQIRLDSWGLMSWDDSWGRGVSAITGAGGAILRAGFFATEAAPRGVPANPVNYALLHENRLYSSSKLYIPGAKLLKRVY